MILLAEKEYARRLAAGRWELLEYLNSLKDLSERRKVCADLFMAMKNNGRVMLAPKADEDPRGLYRVDGDGVAHINIIGELTPMAEQDVSGAYTAEALTEYGYIIAAIEAASNDERVQFVDFHINSPGGYINGLEPAAQAIAALRVPTRAIVDDMAASAAYWLASQTDRIIATSPATRVGSIGVISEEFNFDRALAERGIDHRVYTSTDAQLKYADTNTPEGQAQVVVELDEIHDIFRARVAEGRGVSVQKVNEDFGRGAMMTANAALAAGMIDEVWGQSISRKQQNGAVGASAEQAIKTKGRNMTLEQMKAENLEAYQSAFAEGKAEGVKAERDRVRELSAWKDGHNADTVAVAENAIAQGKTYTEVASELAAAASRGSREQAGANPPSVATAQTVTPSGATETVSGMSDKDVAALKAAGMTMDEIRANAPKGGF